MHIHPSTFRRRALTRFLLLACLVALPAGMRAQITFNVSQALVDSFPRIRIPVQVIDKDGLVTSLSASDFAVRENGADMRPLTLDCATTFKVDTVNVMFVLDQSMSMSYIEGTTSPDRIDSVKWRTAKRVFIESFSRLRPQDFGALISFCDIVSTRRSWTTDKKLLTDAISGLGLCSGTRIYSAVVNAVLASTNRPGRTVIILLTDGADNSKFGYTLRDAITSAKGASIPVYTIGLDVAPIDIVPLDSLSRNTGGKSFYAPTSKELDNIFKSIFTNIYTSTCMLSYTTPDTCRAGGTRLVDVDVSMAGTVFTGETSYSVDDFRSHPRLSFAMETQYDDETDFGVPILVQGELRPGEPLDFDIDVTYDPAAMVSTGISTTGTLLQGSAPSVTESPAGTLRISGRRMPLSGGVLAGARDTLFVLNFHPYAQRKHVYADITVSPAFMRQNCDMLPAGSDTTLTVSGCAPTVTLACDTLEVVESGAQFEVPVRVRTAIDPAQPLTYSFTVTYDTQFLTFLGIDSRYTLSYRFPVLNARETTPGFVKIDAQGGGPADSIGVLIALVFRAATNTSIQSTTISLGSAALAQSCVPAVTAIGTRLHIDGLCERLLVRTGAPKLAQNSPNPVTASEPVTSITCDVTGDGRVRLDLWDISGKHLATLFDGQLAAGRHTFPCDLALFPPGTYMYTLRDGAVLLSRALIRTR